MKQYIKVKRIVGSAAMLLLFFTGSVQAQFQNERYNSNGSKPLDITMISSMVMQGAWLTSGTTSMNSVEVVRSITAAEQLGASDALFKNNTIGGARGLGNNERCALALAPAESRNGSNFNAGFVYVDCDDDMSTFQSSAAMLNIGTDACTEIEKAFLYWTGYDPNGNGAKDENAEMTYVTPYRGFPTMKSYDGPGNVGNANDQNICLFKPAGAEDYISITADALAGEREGSKTYVADVTSQIVETATTNGLYWVANVKSGVNGAAVAAGWSLVVIYKSSATPPRSILLFDGNITVGSGDVQIPINLGNNKPASNNAVSYVGYIGTDGEAYASAIGCNNADANIFTVGSNNGTPVPVQQFKDQPPISYTTHGSSNCGVPTCTEGYDGVVSHTLTAYDRNSDTNGNPISRLPTMEDARYTVGYDAHHVKLPPGAVLQDAEIITFTLPHDHTGDYQARMAYIAIETVQPVLTIEKQVIDDLSNLKVETLADLTQEQIDNGERPDLTKTTITYRIGVTNKSRVEVGNYTELVTVTDPLPAGLDIRKIDDGSGNMVDGIKFFFYDGTFDVNGLPNPLPLPDPANPDICYEITQDAAGAYRVVVKNYEDLPVGAGFYVDIYTQLKPFNHQVWRNSCNRVMKNVAELEYDVNGVPTKPSSDACSTGNDLDAMSEIELEWDDDYYYIGDIPIDDKEIAPTIREYIKNRDGLDYPFEIYRCTDPNGDCVNWNLNPDGTVDVDANPSATLCPSPVTGESCPMGDDVTFNETTDEQVFLAYHKTADGCFIMYVITPTPSSADFIIALPDADNNPVFELDNDGNKIFKTSTEVSCAVNQGTSNDGTVGFWADSRKQAITFVYWLTDANGAEIAGTRNTWALANTGNEDGENLLKMLGKDDLVAGNYFIYVQGLDYSGITSNVVTDGYVDNVSKRLIAAAAGSTPPATATPMVITAPQRLDNLTIVDSSNAPREYCVNEADVINLTAALGQGAGTITFDWTSRNNGTISGDDNSMLTETPGVRGDLTYTVIAKNENNCQSTPVNFVAQVRNVSDFEISGLDQTFCSSANSAIATITNADVPAVTYVWTANPVANATINGSGASVGIAFNNDVANNDAEILVTGTDGFCTNTDTANLNVEQEILLDNSMITVSPDKQGIYDFGDDITLAVTGDNGEPNRTYTWTANGTSASFPFKLEEQRTLFEVTVSNGANSVCPAKTAQKELRVCQAIFKPSPAEIIRCASNRDDQRFTAILDPNSSPIAANGFVLEIFYDNGTSREVTGKLADSKNTGNFLVDAADLDGAIGAEMTAIPQCDASRAKTEKISIQIFNAIQIDELIANGTSYTDPEAEIKEEIRIGEELSIIVNPLTFDPAQHLFFINNDLWTAGNVYVDYPVNDKTYKVVLTDTDRVCSDTKTVRVKVAALPTAVLSSESANYSQYVANNLEKGTFVSVVGNLTIFNRYGQEVFSESSNDPTTPVFWAGQDKDDEQLAPGTYFYVYTTPVGQVQRGTFEVVK